MTTQIEIEEIVRSLEIDFVEVPKWAYEYNIIGDKLYCTPMYPTMGGCTIVINKKPNSEPEAQ